MIDHMVKSNKKGMFYRHAYLWLTLAAVITLAGFFKSYFTKLPTTDVWHHFHGTMALAWLLLLIIEPYLYTRGKIKSHRNLGKISFLIVPLMVLSAFKMVQLMILGKANYPPMLVYQLAFLDFFYIIQFTVFYVMAIIKRKQIQLHARYMAATVFILIGPGLVRLLINIPLLHSFDTVVNISYIFTEIALLVLILDDKRTGKIRLPYLLALGLFALQHVLYFQIVNLNWWVNAINSYASLKW